MKGSDFLLFLVALLLLPFFSPSTLAADTLAINQSIADNQSQTLVSAGGSFELGFFTPSSPSSTNLRYLGIWYNFSKQSVVWVANRNSPLTDSSGVLQLAADGTLRLLNSSTTVVWSTNSTKPPNPGRNPLAQLLDSGNLVVRESNSNSGDYLWQSFDYLSDTILPGLEFGHNRETGRDRYLTSWKSPGDPSPGDCTTRLEPDGYPQIFIRKAQTIVFRSGPWNGLRFSGMPNLRPNPIYTYEFVYNSDQIFYRPYGSCNINNSPPCGCLIGFEPRSRRDWDSGDWAGGCVRRNDSVCGVGEGFQRIVSVKLPDTNTSSYNSSMDLGECEATCLRDCSCTAYSALNVSDGSGCLLWFGDLVDVRHYTEDGQDFFIRLAASDLVSSGGSKRKTRLWIIAVCLLAAGIGVLGLFLILRFRRKRLKRQGTLSIQSSEARDLTVDVSREHDLELPLFDFSTIATATDLFSESRKLGEGGFGPVYKGVFKDGQEMAVKRLSKDSTQGLDEFKNEVKTIAKLQHRNLVKLLGCCIEKEEKVLIYEYMPNKGLDAFIFDQKQRKLLDWPMRFQIINGIARGLLGYMSPEYAIDGQFSIKSDVFSYGVLVLEIICGKRNRGFYHEDHNHNLLGHAWRLYKEGKPEEVMDETVKDSSWVLSEVVRCIHVALLCVQQGPEDRPNMSNVVLMLSSDILLPEPTEPGFFTERKVFEQESSTNEITITLLTAR
ncbi:unnamed protein product [Linum tenue]|uniref:Receptor-like serine/threonine-protein kinase n=1 Tax=Linum tenue TaxID=586396 RepID=A0AAV0M123_9ROSI|nr:unnamed protein product [Linum tenue]